MYQSRSEQGGLILRKHAALIAAASLAAGLLVSATVPSVAADSCTPTGFVRDSINLTAAVINPSAPVVGEVDATGCNIGVYFDTGTGLINGADIHGANYFGVVVNGAVVDVTDSSIHDIGETPLNGSQHGVGIYYAYGSTSSGTIAGNTIWNYQKGGIVANGSGVSVAIRNNVVTGQGPVSWIAQNGIQIGYGASASVMRNTVSGNSYTGTSTVSGGIIVVGGPGYGGGLPYTTGTQIVGNTVVNNDIGIWLTNLADSSGDPPATATNVKVVNNTISNAGLHNDYGGFGYQAGVADQGNNDKIIANMISGDGYLACPSSAYCVAIDADPSFTNNAKVHANVVN
jgi:hypothetical protein